MSWRNAETWRSLLGAEIAQSRREVPARGLRHRDAVGHPTPLGSASPEV